MFGKALRIKNHSLCKKPQITPVSLKSGERDKMSVCVSGRTRGAWKPYQKLGKERGPPRGLKDLMYSTSDNRHPPQSSPIASLLSIPRSHLVHSWKVQNQRSRDSQRQKGLLISTRAMHSSFVLSKSYVNTFSCMYCILMHVQGKKSNHIDKGNILMLHEDKGVL